MLRDEFYTLNKLDNFFLIIEEENSPRFLHSNLYFPLLISVPPRHIAFHRLSKKDVKMIRYVGFAYFQEPPYKLDCTVRKNGKMYGTNKDVTKNVIFFATLIICSSLYWTVP